MTENDQYHRDTCYFCHHGDSAALEEHHIQPRRYDGGDGDSNLVTVCANCHRKLESLYDKSFYDALGVEVEPEPDSVDDTGTSKAQRERIEKMRQIIEQLQKDRRDGAPGGKVVEEALAAGFNKEMIEEEIERLKQRGEVYEPRTGNLRTT